MEKNIYILLLFLFRIIGSTVTLSSEYCFVVEDDEGICGYACAALDTKVLQQKSSISWIPAMCKKYAKTEKGELTPADVSIYTLDNTRSLNLVSLENLDLVFQLPNKIYGKNQ